MKALDLHVEDRAGIDVDAVVLFDVLREAHFVLVLDVHELFLRLRVVGIDCEVLHVRQIRDPLVADVVRDPVREQRVAVQQESSLRDAVGLVVDLAGEHLVEVREFALHEDLRVQPCDAVDGEAGHDREVRHADLSVVDDRHLADLFPDVDAVHAVVLRVDLRLKPVRDLFDDLVDSGKKL